MLVPDDGSDKAKGLNTAYATIIGRLMSLYNNDGPKLAAANKLSGAEIRGIYMSGYQQMICAVVATQFGLRKDQQEWLGDRILAAIKASANSISPSSILRDQLAEADDLTPVVDNPVTPTPQDSDLPPEETEFDRQFNKMGGE